MTTNQGRDDSLVQNSQILVYLCALRLDTLARLVPAAPRLCAPHLFALTYAMLRLLCLLVILGFAAPAFGQKKASATTTTPQPSGAPKPATPKAEEAKTTPKPAPKPAKPVRPVVIVIDPGHGGKDPGKARGSKKLKHEKDLNLAISQKLGAYLQNGLPNVKLIYTRTEDQTVSLEQRTDIANRAKADFFISVHCNANPNRRIYGTRTHIHSHNFQASRELALRIEKEFRGKAGRRSGGIQSAYDRGYNLYVLQYTNMPGVLVECGFMTNPNEEKYLNSSKGQDVIASAIYRAVKDIVQKKWDEEKARANVFMVQIAASVDRIPTDDPRFKGLRVEEAQANGGGTFKYKYLTGREYDKAAAEEFAKKIRDLGFKDAFVVQVQ